MNGPRRSGPPGETPADLARTLRAQARAAATAALREGLEQVEDAHGQHVADEVAGLLEAEQVFAGLRDPGWRPPAGGGAADEEPWDFKRP